MHTKECNTYLPENVYRAHLQPAHHEPAVAARLDVQKAGHRLQRGVRQAAVRPGRQQRPQCLLLALDQLDL